MSKSMMRRLSVQLKDRVETGLLKFGDDWAGLFIRGDDCSILRNILVDYINHGEDSINEQMFAEFLLDELKEVL